MRKPLQISIPNPCHQKWSEMSYIDDNARHCGQCEKMIVDFSRMSDEELISFLRSNEVSCGKFSPYQLDRVIGKAQNARFNWASIFVLPALFAFNEVRSQDTTTIAQPVAVHQPHSAANSIRVTVDAVPTFYDSVMVCGKVLEAGDSLQEYPLMGAVVIFHLPDSTRRGCVTDEDGKFSIKLDSANYGDTVQVEMRYIGYEPYFTRLVLQKEVLMEPVIIRASAQSHTVGVLIVETPRSKTRRFFWRVFHPRYWFRRY